MPKHTDLELLGYALAMLDECQKQQNGERPAERFLTDNKTLEVIRARIEETTNFVKADDGDDGTIRVYDRFDAKPAKTITWGPGAETDFSTRVLARSNARRHAQRMADEIGCAFACNWA